MLQKIERSEREQLLGEEGGIFPVIIEHVAREPPALWDGQEDLCRQISKDKRDRKYSVCLGKSTWSCIALTESKWKIIQKKRDQSQIMEETKCDRFGVLLQDITQALRWVIAKQQCCRKANLDVVLIGLNGRSWEAGGLTGETNPLIHERDRMGLGPLWQRLWDGKGGIEEMEDGKL